MSSTLFVVGVGCIHNDASQRQLGPRNIGLTPLEISMWIVLTALLLSATTAGYARAEEGNSLSSAEREKQLEQRDSLTTKAIQLRATDKLTEAIAELERAWEIETKVFGPAGQSGALLGERLIRWRMEDGRDDAAGGLQAQMETALKGRAAPRQWEIKHFAAVAEQLKQIRSWDEAKRSKLREAGKLVSQVIVNESPEKAMAIADRLQQLRTDLWGPKHFEIGLSLYSRGSLLSRQREFAKAEAIFQDALEIWQAAEGKESPWAGRAWSALANACREQKKWKEAVQFAGQAKEIFAASVGEENGDYVMNLRYLETAYRNLGDREASIVVLRERVGVMKKWRGEDSGEYAEAEFELGRYLSFFSNKQQEAVPPLEDARRIFLRAEKGMGLNTAKTSCLLGRIQLTRGMPEKAAAMLAESLEFLKKDKQTGSLDYINGATALADYYSSKNDFKQSAAWLDSSADAAEQTFGMNHFVTADVYHRQGLMLKQKGDLRAAVTKLEAAVDSQFGADGGHSRGTLFYLEDIVLILSKQKNYAGAEKFLAEKLKAYQALGEQKTESCIADMLTLGMYQEFQKKAPEAVKTLREAAQLAVDVVGPKKDLYGRCLYHLGCALRSSGEHAAAKETLSKAIDTLESAIDRQDQSLVFAMEDLGEFYFGRGEFADAEKWFRRLHPWAVKVSGADSPQVAHIELEWGISLMETGDQDQSRKLLASVKTKFEKMQDWEQAILSLEKISQSFAVQKDFPKAVKFLNEALAARVRISGEESRSYIGSLQLRAIYRQETGDLVGAESDYKQARNLAVKVLGKDNFTYGVICGGLGRTLQMARKFEESEAVLREALKTCELPTNTDDLYTASVRLTLASTLNELQRKPKEAIELLRVIDKLAQAHPDDARWQSMRKLALDAICISHLSVGDYPSLIRIKAELLEHYDRTTALNTLDAAKAYDTLGLGYGATGQLTKADDAYAKAAAIYRKLGGAESPQYALALAKRAETLIDLQNLGQARSLLEEADTILAKGGPQEAPNRSQVLQTYASFYDAIGDVNRCETAIDESLKLLEGSVGPKDVRTLGARSLIVVYARRHGRFEKAEQAALRLVELQKETDGPGSQNLALALSNLAHVYSGWRKPDQALPLERQSGEILEKTAGKESWHYANHLRSLAFIYSQQGKSVEAAKAFEEVARLYQRVGGDSQVGSNLSTAGALTFASGDWKKAESLLQEAVDFEAKRVGRQHHDYLMPLQLLGIVSGVQNKLETIEKLQREVIEAQRQNLANAATALSEQQQLTYARELRGALDFYLAVTPILQGEHPVPVERIYGYVLAAKGTAFMRQRILSASRRDPQLLPLVTRLDEAAAKLSALSLQGAQTEAIRRATDEKERLEAELAGKSPAFKSELTAQRMTPEQMQAALPDNFVLVDFLEYDRPTFEAFKTGVVPTLDKALAAHERNLVVFVIQKTKIERIELGPVKNIASSLAAWRPESRARLNAERRVAARDLRTRVWAPLAIPAGCTVLISPDGITARIPFAALPGSKPGTYLVDEQALVTIPVPQLLPALLAKEAPPSENDPDKLLLVASADFSATAPAKPAPAGGGAAIVADTWTSLRPFRALAGTKLEMEAIQKRWQESQKSAPQVFSEKAAAEAKFRQLGPDATFIHLATHGFFLDEKAPSVSGSRTMLRLLFSPSPGFRWEASTAETESVATNPGLRTGFVLAGANQRFEAAASALPENDGWVTAFDVASLHFRKTRLVVLSACETARGEEAGGEGVLGLQRAFQTAGADSVIATLWKIPDGATSELMGRFYENLWTKKMPRAEALREAQMWLRKEAVRKPEILRSDGLELLPDEEPDPKEPLSPFWWGAFVLSGDWR